MNETINVGQTRINRLVIVLVLFTLTYFSAGCGGTTGPPGVDANGFDVVPPTVKLMEPWPLSKQWDRFSVSASAVDNVGIREVVFFVDGSNFLGGNLLSAELPPYSFSVDTVGLGRGWHYISARACDNAGNITDTPVVPVWLGYSTDLDSTLDRLSFHNDQIDSIWAMPNEQRVIQWWVRFTPARSCVLRSVSLFLGGEMTDTSTVSIGVWSGDGFPEDESEVAEVTGVDISDSISEVVVEFDDISLRNRNDFFIVISLNAQSESDMLYLGADDGMPPWGRSGVRDDLGWYLLTEKYAKWQNFMVSCELFYD